MYIVQISYKEKFESVDDAKDYLKRVEDTLKRPGIDFIGFIYRELDENGNYKMFHFEETK